MSEFWLLILYGKAVLAWQTRRSQAWSWTEGSRGQSLVENIGQLVKDPLGRFVALKWLIVTVINDEGLQLQHAAKDVYFSRISTWYLAAAVHNDPGVNACPSPLNQ